MTLIFGQYSFILVIREEALCERKVSCPKTYHNDSASARYATLPFPVQLAITNPILCWCVCVYVIVDYWIHCQNLLLSDLFLCLLRCWSPVGYRRKSPQLISLGVGCNQKGIICHEMMHTLGFYHEQGRPDRDKYVAIYWENIQPGQ